MFELAAALKRENPRPHRRAGRPDPAGLDRLGAVGIHPAAALPPPRADGPARPGRRVVFGRFEADAPNERWVGDALHGPKDRRPEDVPVRVPGRPHPAGGRLPVRVRRGHRPAGRRAGTGARLPRCPRSVYVDNGSAFVDAWLLRACGKLGIRLVHCTPHRPQGRGKIERFFRTVNDQFLVEVHDTTAEEIAATDLSPAAALLELNGLFTAWVETGLPPPCSFRDRANPAGPLARRLGPSRSRPGHARGRGVDRGVPVVRAAHRHQDRDGVTARQHLPGRSRAGRAEGRAGVLPVQPRTHRDPLPATRPTGKRCRTRSPGTPTRKPDPKHPNRRRPRPPGSTTCDWSPTPTTNGSPPTRRINFDALYSNPPDPHLEQLPGQTSIDDLTRRFRHRPTTNSEAAG